MLCLGLSYWGEAFHEVSKKIWNEHEIFFFSPNARVLFSGFGGKNVLVKMYKWNKINDSDIGKLTKWWSHYKADKQQDYYHTFDSFNRFG